MAINFGHYLYLSGGMNAAFEPAGLQEDQYAVGINVTSRSGIITPRPDYRRMHLEFEFEDDRQLFEKGRYQGSVAYAVGGVTSAVCVISGTIFLVNLVTGFTRNLSTGSAYLDENVYRCYLCQVEEFLVIQDGTSLPIIVQGGVAWVAPPAPDGPRVGTVMSYGHGRLFTKIGARAISAGDNNMPNDEEAVLKSFEHDDFAIGGAFAVGEDLGEINSLTFANNYDSTTGDGPLLAGTDYGLVTFRVDLNRDDWLTSAFSKVQVRGTGVTGVDAVASLNADTLFWSREGLRSLAVLQSEVHDARRFVNVSRDVQPLYSNEPEWFKSFICLGVANGRLLSTVGGRTVAAEARDGSELEDVCFDGLFALDFDRIATPARRAGASPTLAYDGIWTGLSVTGILETDDGAVLFGKRGTTNIFCKVGTQTTGMDDYTPIHCRLFTRAFTTKAPPAFEDAPFQQKKFEAAFIWAKRVTGTVPVSLWLSVDGSPAFCKISEMTLEVPMEDWDGYDIPEIGEARGFARSSFPSPSFQCDPSTGRSLLSGYDFQFCIEWHGMMTFSRFLFQTTQIPEETGVHCLDTTTLMSMSRFSTDPEVRFLSHEHLTMYPGDLVFDNIVFRHSLTTEADPGPGSVPAFTWPAGYPAYAAIWEDVVYGAGTEEPDPFPDNWPIPWPFTEPRFPDMPAGSPNPGEVSTIVPSSFDTKNHMLAVIMSDGSLQSCGQNDSGQLGLGLGDINEINNTLKTVSGGFDWDDISFGIYSSLALRDGKLFATGDNSRGQLGLGDLLSRSEYTQIGIETTWTSIASGRFCSFAIRDGKLFAWGYNNKGQLGLGDTVTRLVPTQVGVATDWVSVAGSYHCLAIKGTGKLYSWGLNYSGQLGQGTHGAGTDLLVPTQVGVFTDWDSVSVTQGASFAIRVGKLYSWGHNFTGTLGQGDLVNLDVPTQVVGGADDWDLIRSHNWQAFGLRGGTLWSWGYGANYRLGYYVAENQLVPAQVGLDADWDDVGVQEDGAIGRKGTELYSWGRGDYGELADNSTTALSVPVQEEPTHIPYAWELDVTSPVEIVYGIPFDITITAVDRTGTGRIYDGAGAMLAAFFGSNGVDLDAGPVAGIDLSTGWVANVWTGTLVCWDQTLLDNNIDRVTFQAATRSPLQAGVVSPSTLVSAPRIEFTVDAIGSIDPVITAAGLVDADITWVRPDLTTFTGKAPASALFTVTGTYSMNTTTQADWDEITAISFYGDSISGDISAWVLPINLITLELPGTSVSGDISAWVLPDSLESLLLSATNVSGDIGSWVLPSSLVTLTIGNTSVSGDIGSWVLPASLVTVYANNTFLSGDISTWTFPASLDLLNLDYTSLTYGTGGAGERLASPMSYFYLRNIGLTTTEVDRVLADCVLSEVLGPSNLGLGGTNAVASAAGIASKATLVSRGWSVFINI